MGTVRLRLCAGLAAVITGLCMGGVVSAGTSLPLPDPVARVNGNPISRVDLRREVARLERSGGGAVVTRDREKELLREALDNLIDRELLYREALRQGFGVARADVTVEVAGLKGGAEGAIEFEQALGELNLSEKELHAQAERSMIARAFMEKRFAQATEPSEVDIASFYDRNRSLFAVPEQFRIRHILVKFDNAWQLEKREAARQKAVQLQKRAVGGEEFAALALEASDCPSRTAGGDLGWVRKGQLVPFMERILLSLPMGGISEPVDDRFGFHVMQVTDRRPARAVTMDESRPRIRDYLRQEQIVRRARDFARSMRDSARVEILVPQLNR